MAVYYKFKSAKDYDSIPMDGPFISVGTLKEKIFESKHLGRGTDFDLVVTNAQTNEEYLDEAMLIPKNTSVLIRRVPGRPRMPIVAAPEPKVEDKVEHADPGKTNFSATDSSVFKYPDDSEWDDLGGDLYEIPEALPVQLSNSIPEAAPTNKADEDSKIQALIDTPALDWQHQGPDGFGPGRGFGRGMGGRIGGRGFGRGGLERKTPPQGYVCHRCKVPGHFIQHCPTNGDPTFDIKRVKPPTGIPKSMLMATPDGSYALPSGAVAVLRPNEAAFDREVEGLPSTRSVGDLPPELHCPLCREVMKDAVLTSKCCFKSFCDKCIRDQIISKAVCVCGATDVLADDLLPNKTLRDTINRILESGNSSTENAGSTFQVQDMESARCPQPRIPSPTMSAASKGEERLSPANKETPKVQEIADETKPIAVSQQTEEKVKTAKLVAMSEATRESASVKEPASQGSAPPVEEEVQQKVASFEAGKKKKKKKVRAPANDLQWRAPQDLPVDNYMMPMGPSSYNPYWTGMQPGMDYMAPYAAHPMPYMGYGLGPLDMPFGGFVPHDPFAPQGCMFPGMPPQRDLADFSMGMNLAPPPIMSREEFEARKADLRRKRENERQGERVFPKDRDFGREVSSTGNAPSMKPKSKSNSAIPPSPERRYRQQSERSSIERPSRDLEPLRPPKRKSEHHHHDRDRDRDPDRHRDPDRDRDSDRHRDRDQHDQGRDYDRDIEHRHHHHQSRRREDSSGRPSSDTSTKPPTTVVTAAEAAALDRKQKASVFSRISFPEGEASKKRKRSSSSIAPEAGGEASASSGHYNKSTMNNGYYDDYKSSKGSMVAPSVSRKLASGSVGDNDSSDDDRHFKRKPSRYESSPAPMPPRDEEEPYAKHSRGSRERERERERSSKHR